MKTGWIETSSRGRVQTRAHTEKIIKKKYPANEMAPAKVASAGDTTFFDRGAGVSGPSNMVGIRSVNRRSGGPCWNMFAIFAVGTLCCMLLASPISADETSETPSSDASSDEGENVTTPSTPLRRFVWRVRNWMFHRDDEDTNTNIEVDATEAAEPTNGERTTDGDCDGSLCKPKSWARSLAAWFARGIRNLLEQLYPPEDGTADGSRPEGVLPARDGTTGNPDDKPKDGETEDTPIKPNRGHVFRPWTALPPPPPPGMPGSPSDSSTTESGSSSSSASTGGNSKPPTTVGSTSPSDVPVSSTPAKKPKRRRPKPITTTTPEMPSPIPPVSTEETYIQDTGNEI